MTLLESLLRPQGAARNPADDFWWSPANAFIGRPALSGVMVSPDSAAKVSAVYACARIISESLASLPAIVYRRLDNGARVRDPQHPAYKLLHDRPNAWQTPFQFKHLLQWNVLFRGAGYAEYVPGMRGQPDQLKPIHPDLVRREQLADGSLRFMVRDRDSERERPILQEDMFHVDGLSLDGVNPVSVVTYYARESIGLAIAAEQFAARVYSQGALHKGVLQHPGALSEDAQQRLRAEFMSRHAGLDNAHAPLILEEGMSWSSTSMTVEDASLIETRTFQVSDIARWFGVPLHLIQSESKDTSWGSGIEQLSLGFVKYTLVPWLTRWEEAASRDLIGTDDATHFLEFLVDALLRADLKTRYESYMIATGGPWMTRNEVRTIENQNPIEDLDEVLQPLNYATVDQAATAMDAKANPPAPVAPPAPPEPTEAPAKPKQARADLDVFVRDAAARVVRKEIAAIDRISSRFGDAEARARALTEFFAEHAAFVEQVLHLDGMAALAYCRQQHKNADLAAINEQASIDLLVTLSIGDALE